MKKKILIVIGVLLLVLLFPMEYRLRDGGTREYKSLVYKVTKLNRVMGDNTYEKGWIIEIFGIEVYNGSYTWVDNVSIASNL